MKQYGKMFSLSFHSAFQYFNTPINRNHVIFLSHAMIPNVTPRRTVDHLDVLNGHSETCITRDNETPLKATLSSHEIYSDIDGLSTMLSIPTERLFLFVYTSK